MKVLLDHNLPVQLKLALPGHSIFTAREKNWETLKNGNLMAVAEESGFEVLVTGDQNLAYQQNHLKRRIALVVLTQIRRRLVMGGAEAICEALTRALPGSYEVVHIPTD